MNVHTAILLLTTLTLSGCTMIPKYSTPESPVRDSWPVDVSVTPDAESVASIHWSEFFQSPGLRTVIETALAENRDLRVAALRIEEARHLYRIQRSNLLPSVNAQASNLRQKFPETLSQLGGVGGLAERYDANVAVNGFELDLFGRVRSENRAALEDFLSTQEARDALQISLIAETANAYLQWLSDREILRLSQETLAVQEKARELIAERYANGVASKLDLAQVRTSVETARVSAAFYTRLVAQDRNALALLMGDDAPDLLSETNTLEGIEILERLPIGLPSEVLLLRPDIQSAEHALKSENARIGAARAAFLPRITLTGSYGYQSLELSQLFSSAALGAWTFVPQITMPIFQSGRNLANLDLAHVRKNIAIAEYERTIQGAFREVADELAAKQTLEDQLKAQRNLVQAAKDSYDLSLARYQTGVDNYLSVLDAQRSLFTARQNEINIQRQRLANLVNLYKALGGGAAPAPENDVSKTVDERESTRISKSTD